LTSACAFLLVRNVKGLLRVEHQSEYRSSSGESRVSWSLGVGCGLPNRCHFHWLTWVGWMAWSAAIFSSGTASCSGVRGRGWHLSVGATGRYFFGSGTSGRSAAFPWRSSPASSSASWLGAFRNGGYGRGPLSSSNSALPERKTMVLLMPPSWRRKTSHEFPLCPPMPLHEGALCLTIDK
jgi:hypothetical protein